ncbi:hypothetical protein Bca52824_013464 [Brassica carinata]|uniref:Protein kinase domain-containing protein n=1 Tax=Brassica carinata TaxID=52824 RepID=A0A8X7VYZ7_BRACI|nr:hypothetical protein Bca52824_013464 [Brassica carinata]
MKSALLLWSHLSLLLVLILASADLTASRSSCPSHCGNISIPYPFGIGKGCYLNEWFAIQCNNFTSGDRVPYLPKINKEVVNISLPEPTISDVDHYGSLRIKTNITSMGCSNTSDEIKLVGCISTCEPRKILNHDLSCRGNKCCQADPPSGVGQIVGISMEEFSSNITRERGCRVAFLTDENRDLPAYPVAKFTDPQWFYDRQYVILQLRWAIQKTNLSFTNSLGCGRSELSHYIDGINHCGCSNTDDESSNVGCACNYGYTDIDECQLDKDDIKYCEQEGGTCVNTPGDYQCVVKKNKTVLITIADLTASKSSCPSHCGNISIPYPFGIEKGCYLNEWFAIQCNNSTSGELVPYLPKINKEVVKIFLPESNSFGNANSYGSLRIKTNITSMGCSNSSDEIKFGEPLNFTGSPFTISRSNIFQAIGCNYKATLTHLDPTLVGCISTCEPRKTQDDTRCRGYKCCQADPPSGIEQIVGISMEEISSNITRERVWSSLLNRQFREPQGYAKTKVTDPQWFYDRQYVILQLQWAIPLTSLSFINSLGCIDDVIGYYILKNYTCGCFNNTNDENSSVGCACKYGYIGNPYILGGCKDIDECKLNKGTSVDCKLQGGTCVNTPGSHQCVYKKDKTMAITIGLCVGLGVLIFSGATLWLYKFIRKQRKINRKKKLFKRNGGLLLKQQLTATEGSIEKTKVFTSKELEKATENFNSTRVLGQGGQGTVYKGMLVDGRIVAVKKSTVVDEDKLEEFINEVVILSQINHRNIVKLIGCCLETEVPLLVYEFISNGNLFEHLHGEFDESAMTTWEMRLRIVIDIAGALSYLHSAAASPIFHRDVKSTNIMLDEKYRAKVSDFGTSRSVTVDHTHLTTVVSGTVGYVDPEYFQSSQFTDKSDVYSFGVVLVELITGEKPISFVRFQQSRTLATYFIVAMEENRIVDIIDPQIRDDCNVEQVMAAAQLARRCLNLNGRNRPSMREVSMELERIRSPNADSQSHVHIVGNNAEEVDAEIYIGVESCNNVGVTAPSGFQYNIDTTSWVDAEPLFPRQTW